MLLQLVGIRASNPGRLLRSIIRIVIHDSSLLLHVRQALLPLTVPASASMSNEMILHAVMTASQLGNVTAAFVFHSGDVLVNRIPRTLHG